MIVAAHHPSFLPSLAYLDKMAKSDLFVVMDDLPFELDRLTHRQRIKVADGAGWLTVPVAAPANDDRVLAARIDHDIAWRRRTWLAIETHYGSAPHFARYADELREVFATRWERVLDLDLHLLELARGWLRIHVPIVRASSLGLAGTGTERLIDLCGRVNAHGYLAGSETIDDEVMGRAGIRLIWQHFDHPVYGQRYPELGFVANLGFLDLLLNHGPHAREILFHRSHPLRASTLC